MEIGSTQRKQTYIAYRLIYNLVYEILRGKWTRLKDSFFSPSLAYNLDPRYKQDINDVVEAYKRNKEKLWGAWNEYYSRGSTIKDFFPYLEAKVRGWCSQQQAHCCNTNVTY